MISIRVLTLFPEAIEGVFNSSILRRAQANTDIDIKCVDIRHYAKSKHKNVDATPYGGGQGMVFKPEVLEDAVVDQLKITGVGRDEAMICYASPRGVRIHQSLFDTQAKKCVMGKRFLWVLICGRYEGVDERFIQKWVDLEFSLGDFILTGGEIPSMAFVDGVIRLIPGVLGNVDSARNDSFSHGLIEEPYFTRPSSFDGLEVPEVLMSGDHSKITAWKESQSLQLTFAYRPDLIEAHNGECLSESGTLLLEKLKSRLSSKP